MPYRRIRMFEGVPHLSVAEVAERTGLSPSTVRRRIDELKGQTINVTVGGKLKSVRVSGVTHNKTGVRYLQEDSVPAIEQYHGSVQWVEF